MNRNNPSHVHYACRVSMLLAICFSAALFTSTGSLVTIGRMAHGHFALMAALAAGATGFWLVYYLLRSGRR